MLTSFIEIEADNNTPDIQLFVKDQTKSLRRGRNGKRLYLKSDTLEVKIVQTLTENAHGM